MMSHYPSTAELAAFRRGYFPRYVSSGPICGPDTARPFERDEGIGYREVDPVAMCIVIPDGAVHTGVIARRRAGVLRSRAYLAECHYCDHPTSAHTGHADGGEPDACTVPRCGCQWWDENTYGNPFAPMHV